MTHPYEEMKEMQKLKKHYDRLGYIADAQYRIPTYCPCGGEIKQEASPKPKYPSDFDTLLGLKYFTCKSFKDDGMHFCQPWAFGVEEEIQKIRFDMNVMAEEIAELKRLIARP